MPTADSSYAKPFLTVPEQIHRLRERGMDCGDESYAADILERYGYYRLSGYWYPFRKRPVPSEPQLDENGREVRLDTFAPGTSLSRVVALYEFDHELRIRLSDALTHIETAFRYHIGHRLGMVDKFAHRDPEVLGAVREAKQHPFGRLLAAIAGRTQYPRMVPTNAYRDWLEEYERHEKRARGDFVLHFREKYGPHLPIWVATEVMSFGLLSSLYDLMRQSDQEILAARFQVHAADGRGDRSALSNWLNSLRNVRNICAHYGRVWNRTFDVIIQAPGQARNGGASPLGSLVDDGINNSLYGVLLVMRHLMLSIDPENTIVADLAGYIDRQSSELDFDIGQLGFPNNWQSNTIWNSAFTLDRSPMQAASLLDRTECLTAPRTRRRLTSAKPEPKAEPRTSAQLEAAKRGAQKSLLRTYLRYNVVIEIQLGETKYYPAFQFRDGKIIDALAEINQKFASACISATPTQTAKALLDWWQTPHPGLPPRAAGTSRSPLDLLIDLPEQEFVEVVDQTGALNSFVTPE